MSSLSAKRQREVDFGGPELDWERERKKPRPLPFRTSPTSKHTTLFSQTRQFLPVVDIPVVDIPSTITPIESSDDDDHGRDSDMVLSPRSQTDKKDDMPFLSIRIQPCPDTDSDLEMTDQPRSSSNPISPCSTAGLAPSWPGSAISSPIPHRLITQSLNISGGRTATPIYGHFTANMNLNTMSHGSNIADDTSAVVPSSTASSASAAVPAAISSSSTGSLSTLTDGEDWWRRRRLPSPISEDEVSPTTTFPQINRHLKTKTPTTIVTTTSSGASFSSTQDWESKSPKKSSSEQQQQQSQTPSLHLNHNIPPAAAAAAGSSTLSPHTYQPIPAHNHNWHIDNSLHAWSHHTTTTDPNTNGISPVANDNTTTLQRERTGRSSKVSIAMGYRADCDKCQRRVPGHYSHIIRG